jgi:hypothetical protein
MLLAVPPIQLAIQLAVQPPRPETLSEALMPQRVTRPLRLEIPLDPLVMLQAI